MNARRGFALIAALWLIVMLSSAGAALVLTGRHFRLTTANALAEARARRAVEAGLTAVLAGLDDLLTAPGADGGIDPDPWGSVTGTSVWKPLGEDSEFRVDLADVNSRLNLNRSAAPELERLLSAVGAPAVSARTLAGRIVDWRDADYIGADGGPELLSYAEQQRLRRPANEPFHAIAELIHIPGISASVFVLVRPHLTLLGDGRVNVNTADPAVLSTLPGMTADVVAALSRLRASGARLATVTDLVQLLDGPSADTLRAHLPELVQRTVTETRVIEARIEGRARNHLIVFTQQILVERVGDRARVTWSVIE